MRLLILALACISALATSAAAQVTAPATSPEQRQAQAQQMIAAANGADIFAFEDHAPAVAIRHSRSGLLCRFTYGAEGEEISIVPSTSLGVAHGDDVACSRRMRTGTISLYATRRPDVQTSDHALEGAVAALMSINPSARPATLTEVDATTLESRPLPEGSRTAAFIITANGEELFTRVSVYVRDGWTYKLRFTSPAQRANVLADLAWAGALGDLPPAEGAN